MTETACPYLALFIRSTRLHVPVLGLNSKISFKGPPSYPHPPKDIKLIRQFSDNNYCYLLPVIITLWSMFAPLRPWRGVGSSPE